MYNHSVLTYDSATYVKGGIVAIALIGCAIGIACNVTVRQDMGAAARPKSPAIIHLPAPKSGSIPVKQYISPPAAPMPPIENEPFRPEKHITRGFAGLSRMNAA